MAQPLPQPTADTGDLNKASFSALSGIDASAARLEQAFLRLEEAVARSSKGYASLKADQEKLNHLLKESEREIAEMREVVNLVTGRLDHTISTLEAWEQ